jgi:hypothetical protein
VLGLGSSTAAKEYFQMALFFYDIKNVEQIRDNLVLFSQGKN